MVEKIRIVPDDFDKGDEEIKKEKEEPVEEYHVKKGYGGERPQDDMSFKPLFSYSYIDTEKKTDYHFSRSEFDNEDACSYFKKLKDFSKLTVDALVNDSKYGQELKLSFDLKSREFDLLQQLLGIDNFTDENSPVMGHFRLNQKPFDIEKYEKGEKQKAPRIFFLLDTQSRIHILFYDPFHEIHPMGKSTYESLKKQAEEEKNNKNKEG